MVEAGDLVEGAHDAFLEVGALGPPGLAVRREVALAAGVEPGLEQLHQVAGDVDVVAERPFDVVLGERRATLAHVLRVGAQHGRLPPGEAGSQDECVEAVALVLVVPRSGHRVLEQLAHVVGHGPVVAQSEVVDVGLAGQALELVGPLVDDLDAHGGQDRQHLGERQRWSDPVDLQPCLTRRGGHVLVQRQGEPLVPLDLLETPEVDRPGLRRVVLLVRLGEGAGIDPHEPAALLLAVRLDDRGGEVVAPRPGRLGAASLEVRDVGIADELTGRRTHDEVQPCREGLPDVRGVLDAVAAELLGQDRGDPLPDRGVVAVTRQVDQAGQEAAVDVATDEELQLPALTGVHHLRGDGHEVLDRRLEQLVARIGLEHVHQRLAGVAHRVETDDLDDLPGLLAEHRDPADRLGVRGRGEQPEEAALTDDLALLVELLHTDVVEVDRTVHGRLGVGLREHEQVLVARP